MTAHPGTLPLTTAVPLAADLARHGDRVAVVTSCGVLTYRQLAARVRSVADRLGGQRRLVLLAARNDVDSLVTYLAALSAGHPVLLVPGDKPAALEALVAAYDPDVVARSGGRDGWTLEERRSGSSHELHPDLALLLSTSGSTGSPRLVRLSHANVESNAEAIADCLGIRDTDRAATTLPMAYSYGLSVVNSHLLRGAALVLTDLSVVDPCFWDLARSSGVTSFAGVPYTFDLLDRVGFADLDLPRLRYLTQAGGRLEPATVQRYAELGRRRGWDLLVMYGQTEATARIACLPPDLAATNPSSIGRAVPGGSLRLDRVPGFEDGVGELVYSGPNVMLGYADTAADLALGRTVDELRTGDLARVDPAGLFVVVGRRNRFVKVVGLRIDLGRVESLLAGYGVTAACAGTDDGLVVAVEGDHDARLLRQVVTEELGLPPRAVTVRTVDELPRLASGKPDLSAVLALGPEPVGGADPGPAVPPDQDGDLRTLFATLLDRPGATDADTFVSLGGDSLSYVEVSVQLEEQLGYLPPGWHTTPIGDLAHRPRPPRRTWHGSVETSVALRALAIILIVGTHSKLFSWWGSAHVLMAVAGFNYARFQLTSVPRLDRLRHQARSVARVAVPSVALIAVAHALTDRYTVANVLLLNAVVGPETWTTQWHFWFVEVLVYLLVGCALLLAVPWVDRVERRLSFGVPMVLVAVGLLGRFDVVDLGVPHTKPVLWLFAIGWAAARARSAWQRLAVTAVVAVAVPGFFDDPRREAVIAAGLLLLLWVPSLPGLGPLNRALGVLASSSLYIYLTHWLVYPELARIHPLLAVVGSLAAGVVYWALSARVAAHLAGNVRRRRAVVQA